MNITFSMTGHEKMTEFIKSKRFASTAQCVRFGLDNGVGRAERAMRELAEQGVCRRMSEDEKKQYYGESKEDVWCVAGFPFDKSKQGELF